MDNKYISLSVNKYIDKKEKETYTKQKVVVFNVTINKIPFGCEIISKKCFELTNKYSSK
jgi:hypothetical protein